MHYRFATWSMLAGLMILIGSWSAVRAQQATSLTGRVLDATTDESLPGVNVFIAGTTFGTASDTEGHFEMALPPRLEFEVVASMVGYKTVVLTVKTAALPEGGLLIRLHPETIELDAVEVVAEHPREWQRNLERLNNLLFSSTAYGRKCEILNPEVLDLSYDDAAGDLYAVASQPLEIENRALGYRIVIHGASLQGNENHLQWGGKFQFTELEPKNKRERRKWADARKRAYRGSTRHFLASVVKGSLEDTGFKAYYVEQPGLMTTGRPVYEMRMHPRDKAPPALIVEGPEDETWLMNFSGTVYVSFNEEEPREYIAYHKEVHGLSRAAQPEQSSWLSLTKGGTVIDAFGNDYVSYALEEYGYWGWERMGEQLPYDYQPN